MQDKYKISICMMVKDEEKNIRRCLESLKPLIDSDMSELIIVDTGSTDKTVEIAGEYTSKLYYHKWNNDFSAMRNITISYAKGEWILIIDADEVLEKPEELINLFLNNDLSKYNTVVLQVGNVSSRKSNDSKAFNPSPRIFRNDGLFKYVGTVHNQPLYKAPLFFTDISIKHYGYIFDDRALMDKKFERTRALLIKELEKNPANVYYQFQLGVTYDMHGDTLEALQEFRKAYDLLEGMKKSEKAEKIFVYGAYARCANNSKKYQEAVKICEEGIGLREDFIDFYYIAGVSNMAIGQIQGAINLLTKYIELVNNKNNLEISKDMSVIFYNIDEASKSNAYTFLCQCYIELNDYKKAAEYISGIKNKSNKARISAKVYIKMGDYDGLKEMYIYFAGNDNARDIFISCIEENMKMIDDGEKVKLREKFAAFDDIYGKFNRAIIYNGIEKERAVDEFLSSVDFNKDNILFSGILCNVLSDRERLFNILKAVNTQKIREIENYIISNFPQSIGVLKEHLSKTEFDPANIDNDRLYIALALVLLMKHLEDSDEIYDDYYAIFRNYIKRGINVIKSVYKPENSDYILKHINNDEDRFLCLMSRINDCILNGDKKNAAKLLIDAVNAYKIFVKYIEKYKEELLEENSTKSSVKEFEEYKLKVKETIGSLIAGGFINDAKEVINQYEGIVKRDIEILYYKSQIALAESK